MNCNSIYPVVWKNDRLCLIDQTRLPAEYLWVEIASSTETAEAIKTMIVRGAPAIGITAAYGIYLGATEITTSDRQQFLTHLATVADMLRATRPTAVNLFWAIAKMMDTASNTPGSVAEIKTALLATAQAIQAEDLAVCQAIGDWGLTVLPAHPAKLRILTHCNAGALATAGYGTALGVIRSAWREERLGMVYADETRPRLQGAKLTVWECVQDKIPVTLITDNMSAHCMQQNMIDMVVVGADRIAANGDTANKIGTYGVAIAAKAHQIPFYVAAPFSTIDFELPDGKQIPIEQRDAKEVFEVNGSPICALGANFYTPAFDVTPAELITGIITEQGVILPGDLIKEILHR